MNYYYSLRIYLEDESQRNVVDSILGIASNWNATKGLWDLEIIQGENDQPFPFIDYFLSLVEGKYEQLERVGISWEGITLWMLYEYDGVCEIEFTPNELRRLGNSGITLCISCWDSLN